MNADSVAIEILGELLLSFPSFPKRTRAGGEKEEGLDASEHIRSTNAEVVPEKPV